MQGPPVERVQSSEALRKQWIRKDYARGIDPADDEDLQPKGSRSGCLSLLRVSIRGTAANLIVTLIPATSLRRCYSPAGAFTRP